MRRFRERHPVLAGVLATVVAVAAVVAVLAAVTPSKPRIAPVDEQAQLEKGHELVDRALGSLEEEDQGPATTMFTATSGDLHVRGARGESSFSPGLPVGVNVGFFRARGRDFAYCLASRHRHLTVQTNPTQIVVGGGRGACPRPSLRPVHLNN